MDLLIKSAKIVDSTSAFNGKEVDILIEQGTIAQIGEQIANNNGYQEVTFPNLHVSVGWLDMRANLCDPGYEYKEDISSGIAAAAAGGYSEVVAMPNSLPVTDSKSGIEYIINKAKGRVVTVFPAGSVSVNGEGKEIAEMYDMHQAGAVVFTDNKRCISNPSLLNRALLYTKPFGGVVMNFPNDQNLCNGGQINEGVVSTKIGLKGIPAIAEELVVMRDIKLAQYCDAAIHLTNISTKKSVELIREAKANGLKVTADVNSYHLLLDEDKLEGFDTNYKVVPPLRTKLDVEALIDGLKDGTIDAICSDHTPEDVECKQCEFDHAAPGMINLQTSFPLANTALSGRLSLADFIDKLTVNPRNILNIEAPKIQEGVLANLTLFDPQGVFTLTEDAILSKSKNTPFINEQLTGVVYGVINNGQMVLNKNNTN